MIIFTRLEQAIIFCCLGAQIFRSTFDLCIFVLEGRFRTFATVNAYLPIRKAYPLFSLRTFQGAHYQNARASSTSHTEGEEEEKNTWIKMYWYEVDNIFKWFWSGCVCVCALWLDFFPFFCIFGLFLCLPSTCFDILQYLILHSRSKTTKYALCSSTHTPIDLRCGTVLYIFWA